MGSLALPGPGQSLFAGPSALAEFLGTTRGTTSQTLIALENKGYLRRRRGLRDKRSVNLELTPAGDALLDRDPLRVVDEVVAGLPAGEKATISGGLSRLLRDVQRRLGGSEFGVCECCSLFSAEGAANEHDGPHRLRPHQRAGGPRRGPPHLRQLPGRALTPAG